MILRLFKNFKQRKLRKQEEDRKRLEELERAGGKRKKKVSILSPSKKSGSSKVQSMSERTDL